MSENLDPATEMAVRNSWDGKSETESLEACPGGSCLSPLCLSLLFVCFSSSLLEGMNFSFPTALPLAAVHYEGKGLRIFLTAAFGWGCLGWGSELSGSGYLITELDLAHDKVADEEARRLDGNYLILSGMNGGGQGAGSKVR